jgi:hypothetical protein
MKTFAALTAALLLAVPCLAAEGQTFGKVSAQKPVKLSELLAKPAEYVGKQVKVEGLITDVCAKRGCWIKLGGDKDFQTITFKVDDGVISFPMSVKGKRAEAEGVFTKLELTQEEALARASHEAEENRKLFDPRTITGPTTVYLLKGAGAIVR